MRPTVESNTDGVEYDGNGKSFKPRASRAGRCRNTAPAWAFGRCRVAGDIGVDELRLGPEPRVFLTANAQRPQAE